MSEEIKSVVESINRAFEEFKAQNDARLAQIEAGGADAVTVDQVKKINDAITNLSRKQAEIEAAAARAAIFKDTQQAPSDEVKAFNRYLRVGTDRLTPDEQKALSSTIDPNGGYLVPTQIDGAISRIVATVSALRSRANVVNISSGAFTKLVSLGGAGGGWVAETGARPETATQTLSAITITPYELYANPAVTAAILQDSIVDIGSMVASEVGITFGELEGAAFVSGNGVTRPRGLIGGYTPVANASYAWGAPGYIATGATGFASSNPADDLIEVQHALKPQYRPGASWMMNDSTLSTVRQFKESTTGNYLWVPGLAGAPNGVLLGSPVDIENNMADVANLAFPIAYGDFKQAYTIVERAGTTVLQDPYTNKPYVHFYTVKRVGGGVTNFEAYKLLRTAAS